VYPQRFDLRHFMSHLAPGAYFVIQVLVGATFFYWLFFPEFFKIFLVKSNNANVAILTAAFFVFVVICYFVGVVLQLPSVDRVDAISIQYNLHKICQKLSSDEQPGWFLRITNSLNWMVRAMQSTLDFESCHNKIKKTYEKIKKFQSEPQKSKARKMRRFLKIAKLKKPKNRDSLQDWITYHTAEIFRNLADKEYKDAFDAVRAKKESLRRPGKQWLTVVLWAADRFPYPLWLSFREYRQTSSESDYVDLFEKHLWKVMLDTMYGNFSIGRFRKEPINRCKLFVCAHSHELASEIYDREALTRMMAGFYRGLLLASIISLSIVVISAVGGLFSIMPYFDLHTLEPLNRPVGFGFCFFTFLVLSMLNIWLLVQVVKNFHNLRLSEAQSIFDGYILAKQGNEQVEETK